MLELLFKRLDTQLDESTNRNSIKVSKVSKSLRNRYYKTLGTSVINSPISLSPIYRSWGIIKWKIVYLYTPNHNKQ